MKGKEKLETLSRGILNLSSEDANHILRTLEKMPRDEQEALSINIEILLGEEV